MFREYFKVGLMIKDLIQALAIRMGYAIIPNPNRAAPHYAAGAAYSNDGFYTEHDHSFEADNRFLRAMEAATHANRVNDHDAVHPYDAPNWSGVDGEAVKRDIGEYQVIVDIWNDFVGVFRTGTHREKIGMAIMTAYMVGGVAGMFFVATRWTIFYSVSLFWVGLMVRTWVYEGSTK